MTVLFSYRIKTLIFHSITAAKYMGLSGRKSQRNKQMKNPNQCLMYDWGILAALIFWLSPSNQLLWARVGKRKSSFLPFLWLIGVDGLCRTTTAPTKPCRLSGDTAISGNITWATSLLHRTPMFYLHETPFLLLIFLLNTETRIWHTGLPLYPLSTTNPAASGQH